MALSVRSLASGSNGNSLLVQAEGTALLIDAGLPLGQLLAALHQSEQSPAAIGAVYLTHEHSDHTRGLLDFIERYDLPLVCNGPTYAALGSPPVRWEDLPAGATRRQGPLAVSSFAVTHDAADPVGFCVDAGGGRPGSGGWRVAVATDLGHWDERTVAALAASDLAVIESNHAPDRLAACGYPIALQRRIRSRMGHLSNEQAAALIVALDRHTPRPRTVWLAHLSVRSNSVALAMQTAQAALRDAGINRVRLAIAPRGKPGHWWSPTTPSQASFWDPQADGMI